jgi:hypothetical protein
MKLMDVSMIYKNEIELLYLLCQYPSGLLYSDIEKLCQLQSLNPEQWKPFLYSISNESKVFSRGDNDTHDSHHTSKEAVS